jgi:predicted transcriptional regulator
MGYGWAMSKLSLELPDETVAKLSRLAERLGTPMESLASAGAVDLVSRPDEQFSDIVRKVLAKNQELYRRLA